jgi:hypothetical protein
MFEDHGDMYFCVCVHGGGGRGARWMRGEIKMVWPLVKKGSSMLDWIHILKFQEANFLLKLDDRL